MAVKIRLRREGTKGRPYYKIVETVNSLIKKARREATA